MIKNTIRKNRKIDSYASTVGVIFNSRDPFRHPNLENYLEYYKNNQDGILYDLDISFPSEIVPKFDDLLVSLEKELISNEQVKTQQYLFTQKVFFNYLDTNNSKRIINKIKYLL